MLITGGEEVWTAQADEDVWFDTVATAAPVLRAAGLQVSLNPWVTVGHADRGRVSRLGFAPMVSPYGEVATAQASFACPRWRAWLAAHYGRFAGLGLRVLWLEDDFRYHNHAPLTWGGGFEPEMLARFAELAGEPVTRAELVAAITGPPHPWRALLARTWFEAQLEAVEAVRAAVAGRAALGLMSSTLGVASVEGREWRRLLAALGPGAVHRPHYAPYTDAVGSELAWSVAMLELQRPLRPAGVEVAPEVENYPFTSWAKSDTQTWSEMVACALSGADGLLLDVVPFTAGSPDRFPAVGAMLSASRPALDFASSTVETLGVGIPWYDDTALHVHGTGDLDSLAVDPTRAARYLLGYGVPIRAGYAPLTAVFGQLARAIPDADLPRLLAGGLLLDGVAASILTERGADLGVVVHEIADRESALYAVEDGESVNQQPALARLTVGPGGRALTTIRTPDGSYWGDGMVVTTTGHGGRAIVLAATSPEDLPRSDERQARLHAAIAALVPDIPLVTGGPHLIPHAALVNGRLRVAVANGSADPAHARVSVGGDAAVAEVGGDGTVGSAESASARVSVAVDRGSAGPGGRVAVADGWAGSASAAGDGTVGPAGTGDAEADDPVGGAGADGSAGAGGGFGAERSAGGRVAGAGDGVPAGAGVGSAAAGPGEPVGSIGGDGSADSMGAPADGSVGPAGGLIADDSAGSVGGRVGRESGVGGVAGGSPGSVSPWGSGGLAGAVAGGSPGSADAWGSGGSAGSVADGSAGSVGVWGVGGSAAVSVADGSAGSAATPESGGLAGAEGGGAGAPVRATLLVPLAEPAPAVGPIPHRGWVVWEW
ncbi:hypothetical protein [Actinokineospora sp. UTMC 2448]|uniref:hypothetical protein n=1 Tax=Actinokineospora sp. UTMC 2448 TaxID=2268449 RepID=UPI002164E3D5|nr:hypothetical protein [Actinokineospora sp. UTMC 2448]